MEKEEKKNSGKREGNDFGVAGVVLGIVAVINSLFFPLAGIALGIIGIVFCLKQKKSLANKWSKNGIILNIIAIVLGLISFVVTIYILANKLSGLSQLGQLGV